MGKRLQRIGNSDIPAYREQLVNSDVHIVLKDGAAYYGIIKGWEYESVKFKDLRNHTHHFLVTDIFEIVIDTLAAY